MDMERVRREDLQSLLVSYRSHLDPEDVGLGAATRRRGPGLRQDQVAALAGVGARWYGALERGEVDSPAPELLDAVAETLRMSTSDYELFTWLAHRHRPAGTPGAATADDRHRLLLERAAPHPAVITDHTGALVAMNELFAAWICESTGFEKPPGNLYLWLFSEDADPVMADIGAARQRVIAHARHACVRYPASEQLHVVLKDLLAHPEAAVQWRSWASSPPDLTSPLYESPLTGARCGSGELLAVQSELRPGVHMTVLLMP